MEYGWLWPKELCVGTGGGTHTFSKKCKTNTYITGNQLFKLIYQLLTGMKRRQSGNLSISGINSDHKKYHPAFVESLIRHPLCFTFREKQIDCLKRNTILFLQIILYFKLMNIMKQLLWSAKWKILCVSGKGSNINHLNTGFFRWS